jgi:membrane protease YdiL (CAAX protease family)
MLPRAVGPGARKAGLPGTFLPIIEYGNDSIALMPRPSSMAAPPRHIPIARGAEHYWSESRRPLASLLFIAPLLIVYEAGVLMLGPEAVRNGADVWLRQLLDWLGFGQYFLLPVLTVCILLGWHYMLRQPWRISNGVLTTMGVESLLLAFALRLLLQLQGMVMQGLTLAGDDPATALDLSSKARSVVGFLGAGIYEELLFRLILLTAVAWAVRRLGARRRPSFVVAIIVTSLLFSAAHYIGPHGESFGLFTFVFRFVAGLFFGLLFVFRGFGIAAGSHAGYDVLVGVF